MIFTQFHKIFIFVPHVFSIDKLFQIRCHLFEFQISFVAVKWNNGYSILWLETIAVGCLNMI